MIDPLIGIILAVVVGALLAGIMMKKQSFIIVTISFILGGALGAIFAALLTGIPQIKPTFLDIAPSGIPSNIIPHSKGIKCGLIRSNSPFSYSNHRPAKPKIPKPLVYAQVSPLGTSFATP